MTEKLRKQMCDIIVDEFLIKKHGVYPPTAEKHALATASANYFKCYKICKEDTVYKGGVSIFRLLRSFLIEKMNSVLI